MSRRQVADFGQPHPGRSRPSAVDAFTISQLIPRWAACVPECLKSGTRSRPNPTEQERSLFSRGNFTAGVRGRIVALARPDRVS